MSTVSNQRRCKQSPGGQLLANKWVFRPKLRLKLSSEGGKWYIMPNFRGHSRKNFLSETAVAAWHR